VFKKIEIWILYVTIVLAVIFAIFFGTLVRQELVGSVKLGPISKFAVFLAEIPMNIKKIFEVTKDPGIERSVGEDFVNKYGFVGEHKGEDVFLLLSRFDGNIKEAVVELVDLKKFKVIHKWNPDVTSINNQIDTSRDEYKLLKRDFHENRYKIDSPILTKDGGLIIHPNGSALVKINTCSEIVWINDKYHFHHMSEIDFDENYWIPTSIFPYSLPEKMVGKNYGDFLDDAITKISKDGEILFQKSVIEMLIENDLKSLFFSNQVFDGDPIHLNDIQQADFDSNYWRKGDLFLSLRSKNMIVQYRPDSNKVINIISGPFVNQHDVDIISNEEISIFNNNVHFYKGSRIDGGNLHFNTVPQIGLVEILIYNFRTKSFSKKFENQLNKNDVNTSVQGAAEILDDGSLFIEETNRGRILFLDKNGKLLWEYVNKAKNGKNYSLAFSKILSNDENLKKTINTIKNNKCLN
tara:strand:+ start:645 stop:2039 length:1395 start_codon:yes stop_codon:yes gene_type:complete